MKEVDYNVEQLDNKSFKDLFNSNQGHSFGMTLECILQDHDYSPIGSMFNL